MPNFAEFLIACLPAERDSRLPLMTRFNDAYPQGTVPTVEQPFVLSATDIDLLLELARTHRSQKLLLALANMGTVELNADQRVKDPFDPLIGRRDRMIETALIAKAVEYARPAVVNNLSFDALRSATRLRASELLLNTKNDSTDIDRSGSSEQVQALSVLNSKQPLVIHEPRRFCFVYGLSGNPPTLNHYYFIKHLMSQGEVTVVLNAQSPFKARDRYIDPNIRFEMLQSMFDPSDEFFSRCHLSRLEIDRLAPSRMVVTMSMLVLLSESNERQMLVLGLDALPLFNRWYMWEALAKLCDLKFYPRAGESLDDATITHHLKLLEAGGARHIHMVFNTDEERDTFLKKHPEHQASVEVIPDIAEGSATAIRAYYHQKGTAPDLPPAPATHPRVHEIIQRYQLYRKPSAY